MPDPNETDREPFNPYQPIVTEAERSLSPAFKTFGTAYWVACGLLLAGAFVLTYFVPPFGVMAIMVVSLVLVRSWMWNHRLRRQSQAGRGQPAEVGQVDFFLSSLGFSALASLASVAAFVGSCVPLGMGCAALISAIRIGNAGSEVYTAAFLGLIVLCGLLGFWTAFKVLQATLPKLEEESLVLTAPAPTLEDRVGRVQRFEENETESTDDEASGR